MQSGATERMQGGVELGVGPLWRLGDWGGPGHGGLGDGGLGHAPFEKECLEKVV